MFAAAQLSAQQLIQAAQLFTRDLMRLKSGAAVSCAEGRLPRTCSYDLMTDPLVVRSHDANLHEVNEESCSQRNTATRGDRPERRPGTSYPRSTSDGSSSPAAADLLWAEHTRSVLVRGKPADLPVGAVGQVRARN